MVGWQSGHAFACRIAPAVSEFIGVRIPSPPFRPKSMMIMMMPFEVLDEFKFYGHPLLHTVRNFEGYVLYPAGQEILRIQKQSGNKKP